MDFDRRLQQAIQRGHRIKDAQGQAAVDRAMSEEEVKSRYSVARLNISDYIEGCLKKLADHFPGFRFETIVDETGWGARISRDDLQFSASSLDALFSGGVGKMQPASQKRENVFSRFQVLVRPLSLQTKIIELAAKGTIRNKEVVNRTQFQFIAQIEEQTLKDIIDNWCLEYAERYASHT